MSILDLVPVELAVPGSIGSYAVCMQRQIFLIHGCVQDAISRALILVQLYLPLFSVSTVSVLPSALVLMTYFASCRAQFVRGNAEEKAYLDGQSFSGIPVGVLDESAHRLHSEFNGHLPGFIAYVQQNARTDRFNEERCRDMFSDDPEFNTLLELASTGARVPIEDDFVLQGSPEPLRKLHVRLGQCIPKHAFKLWQDGKALLFKIADVLTCRLHFNNSHWTAKPGVDDGRYLFDCANIANGSTINSEFAFEAAEERYLPLRHPTILEILTGMVQHASIIGCHLSDLRLWKDDIKGAFGQFNMDPNACYLLATQVAAGIVMIYIAGMFGYHACPLIFGVFSRALGRVLSASCSGIIFIYVDDIIGFAHYSIAVSDQIFAQNCIRRTFGSKSVAADKSVNPCTPGEVLGWTVDLALGIVRPNDKAIRKLMWAFFMVDTKASKWPLQQCRNGLSIVG